VNLRGGRYAISPQKLAENTYEDLLNVKYAVKAGGLGLGTMWKCRKRGDRGEMITLFMSGPSAG
jgi:hypothetical protein